MDANPHLTPEQVQALKEARDHAKGIFSACKVATFNGWTLAIFAGLTILFGLTSPVLIALGVGLGVVARNEFRGSEFLRGLDPAGPPLLVKNQLGLMALAVAYCLWSIATILTNPDPQWAELQELLGLAPGYIQDLMVTGYVAAILVTVLFVGFNARYYHKRVEMLKAYLDATPDWVVELLQATRS